MLFVLTNFRFGLKYYISRHSSHLQFVYSRKTLRKNLGILMKFCVKSLLSLLDHIFTTRVMRIKDLKQSMFSKVSPMRSLKMYAIGKQLWTETIWQAVTIAEKMHIAVVGWGCIFCRPCLLTNLAEILLRCKKCFVLKGKCFAKFWQNQHLLSFL